MKPSEFRDMIDKEAFQPFIIKTKAGRRYPISHRANVWVPEDYESTVCVAIRGKGITMLDIKAIESFQFEHESIAF